MDDRRLLRPPGAATDLAAVHARYDAERRKRIRADGNEQYLEPTGRYAHFLDDPWVVPAPRPAHQHDVTFAFVGGGFAGLLAGARLRQAGVDDVMIIEKGGDVGGTWYWNRYPGAQCDTAAMIYLPLLEETGHVPTEKYTHGPEILDHCRRIAEHFGLYERALLSTEVTSLRWDEGDRRWVIDTNRGDTIRARFVGLGTGPLHRPKLPGIAGIDRFAGHSFHTSRWDYEYTGGSPDGAPLDRLAGRRVGVIGTGATAVQCIPHLARSGCELFVFQRTPSSVDTRRNRPIDRDWFATLEPGWQQRWLDNFTLLQTGGFADEDLVEDGWTDIAQRIRDRVFASPEPDISPEGLLRAYHDSDDEKMAEIRARVNAIVDDPVTAAALQPWYRQLCKRPCFHDEFLQAFNRPNVHLIDTDGRGVEQIDADGVLATGRHYPLDCIVFASGFEVGTDYARRSGFETIGRNATPLSQHWADGMRTLHGLHVHGFPNLFVVGPTQAANLISNIPHNLSDAAATITAVVTRALDLGGERGVSVEPTAEAEQAWVDRLEAGGRRFGGDSTCTPGYYNNEGHPLTPAQLRNTMGFPEGPVAYFAYIDQWRRTGEFAGLTFETAATDPGRS